VSYTLIAFTVFSERHGCGHYKAYCKNGNTEWYLFNDRNITKKRGDITMITIKEKIVTQVTSLFYLKNEEATMKKSAEKAQEKLLQEVDRGYDAVGTEESKVLFVNDLAQIQENGGEETNTDLSQEKLMQEVDRVYDAVGTEESNVSFKDLAQIQEKGGEETNADLISEEEEDMTSPNAPTKAPIDPTTVSGTINGAYISYSALHNNIHRSHQNCFSRGGGGFDDAREAHVDNLNNEDNYDGVWDK